MKKIDSIYSARNLTRFAIRAFLFLSLFSTTERIQETITLEAPEFQRLLDEPTYETYQFREPPIEPYFPIQKFNLLDEEDIDSDILEP